MARLKLALALVSASLAVVPAGAAITVIGNSAARLCYEAAERQLTLGLPGLG